MRPADQQIWDLWAHLRDVNGRHAVPKLIIHDDVDVIDGWGLPMKGGKALLTPESKAGWAAPHFEHVLQKFGDEGYKDFELLKGSGQRADVLLSFPGAYTYGHWFIDIMSRVELALTCFDLDDLAFLVPGPLPTWAVPFLSAYGIGRDQLVELGDRRRYRSPNLVIPSLGRESDYLPVFPHATTLGKLKAFGLNAISKPSPSGPKLLVKHKAQTSAGWRATLSNFSELEHRLTMRGFVTICPAEMSRDEQVTAFADARIIVGEDSSALHNVVYSTGARLIVINDANRKNLLHLSICELMGHACHYVLGDGHDGDFSCDLKEVVDLVSVQSN